MARITSLSSTPMDIVFTLSEGNPGAITVLARWIKEGAGIDTDAPMPLLSLLSLDTIGVYGSSIWMLYKDVCGEDLSRFIGLIRSWQLGYSSEAEIRNAAATGQMADIDERLSKVAARLPNFKFSAEVAK